MKINIRLLLLYVCFLVGIGFVLGFYFGFKRNQSDQKFPFSADVEYDRDVDWSKGVTDEMVVKVNIFTEIENRKVVKASFFWNPVLKDTKYIIYNQGKVSEIYSSSTKD